MNHVSLLVSLLLVSVALAGVTVATVRMIRQDRPTTPPGRSEDWREEQLAWSRLGIS